MEWECCINKCYIKKFTLQCKLAVLKDGKIMLQPSRTFVSSETKYLVVQKVKVECEVFYMHGVGMSTE